MDRPVSRDLTCRLVWIVRIQLQFHELKAVLNPVSKIHINVPPLGVQETRGCWHVVAPALILKADGNLLLQLLFEMFVGLVSEVRRHWSIRYGYRQQRQERIGFS